MPEMPPTPKISLFIVDDESLARERLKRLLFQEPGYELVGEAENGELALPGIARTKPDIVILDIRMPGKDGLDVADDLSQLATPPAIIFCTAYDEYAIHAFKFNAIAYLLKPVRQEELIQALKQATQLSQIQVKQLQKESPSVAFVAHTWQGHERLEMNDILFFQADHKYVTVHHTQGETLTDQTLKELETEYKTSLIRAHRNTLVNRKYVKALNRDNEAHYYIELSDGNRVPVSRRHVSTIKSQLDSL